MSDQIFRIKGWKAEGRQQPRMFDDEIPFQEMIHGTPCGHVINGMEIDLAHKRIAWPGRREYGLLEYPFEIMLRGAGLAEFASAGLRGAEPVPNQHDPEIHHMRIVGRRRLNLNSSGIQFGNRCPFCGYTAVHRPADSPWVFLDENLPLDFFKVYPYCYSIFVSQRAADFISAHMPLIGFERV